MKKPLKVALFSGLIFPGVGHFMLKKYFSGGLLLSSFAIALYFITSDIIDKSKEILQQVQSGAIPLDVNAISTALNNISTGLSQQQLSQISYVLLFIWLISIIDSYRLAVGLSKKKSANSYSV